MRSLCWFMMKIALIHYHLKRGGVTTVIKQQIGALAHLCDCLVISGSPPTEPFPCEVAVVPGLGYDIERDAHQTPASVAEAVQDVVFARWPKGCDILHIHNPLLAKNRDYIDILHHLRQSGMHLFMQIHDFAEDGRPQAYFRQQYPGNCHYGVINSRDYGLLIKAGLCKKGLHLIPNAVQGPGKDMPCAQVKGQPRVLYPVRAIRRKNIGEVILLSLFFGRGVKAAITLPPNSPADLQSYLDWKAFVGDCNLAVAFDAGLHQDFSELVRGSRLILSTSITEGFGFCYTEPWLYNKPLWGRILPEICRDFIQKGLRLDHLYSTLVVPLDWFDSDGYFEKWRAAVTRAANGFGMHPPHDDIARVSSAFQQEDCLDFGMLDEASQRQVIQRLLMDADARDKLAVINPFLSERHAWIPSAPQIAHNRRVVKNNYSLSHYGRRLISVYRRVKEQPVHQQIDKDLLLDLFFDLERFSLLKWSAYDC